MTSQQKISTKINLVKSFGFFSAIIATTLIQSRAYLKGFYYGDPFDGRLMVVLHEHWWQFFRGRRDFLDTYFFYPFDRGLGFSDNFFLQGIFYSLARAFKFDLIDSWALATISILILSNIGIALLAKQTLQNFFLQISLIIIVGSSFTFFAFLNMSPNVASYGLVSYLAYFLSKLFNRASSDLEKNMGFLGVALTFPILLLSAWYAAFFSALFLFFYFIVHSVSAWRFLKMNLYENLTILKSLNTKLRVISVLIFTILTSLWVYIYLPVAGNVDRSVEELQAYSIKLEHLSNSASLGGGFFYKIYNLFGFIDNGLLIQDQNGITFSLFLVWIFLGIYFILSYTRTSVITNIDFKLWIALTLQIIFFIQLTDFSIFQLIWEAIPALKAIRVSSRMLILVSALIIFILHRFLDKNLQKNRKSKLIIAFTPFLLLVVFIDQIRFENVTWKKKNYFSDNYKKSTQKAKNLCSAFYLDSEGEEWWNDQLTAMMLSARLNFPTANGYSGGYPNNYPTQPWRSQTNLVDVVEWLANNDVLTETCLIRPNGIIKLDTEILFDAQNGFDLMEKSGGNTWWWSKDKVAELSAINLTSKSFDGFLDATLEIPPCQTTQIIKITNRSTGKNIMVELERHRSNFQIPFFADAYSENIFTFEALRETCQLEDDPRLLFFSLKNPTISD